MKKNLFIIVLCAFSTAAFAQISIPNEENNKRNDTISLMYGYDYYIMSDFSKELNSAGNNFLWSFGFTAAAGISAYISAEVYKKEVIRTPKDQTDYLVPLFFSVGFGVTSIICYITAANNLKKAAKNSNKIHPIHGGLSVDF